MQNKENYSKITFTDGDQIILQNYQVINDKIIFCKYNNFVLKNTEVVGVKKVKTYEYFNKWVEKTSKKSLIYVPSNSTTLTAEKKSFVVETMLDYLLTSSNDYINIPINIICNDAVFYVKNAYSSNAPVKLLFGNTDFKVYNEKTLYVQIHNITNLINTKITVSIDIYNDISRINKIGMIDFDFNVVSSNNPSGD